MIDKEIKNVLVRFPSYFSEDICEKVKSLHKQIVEKEKEIASHQTAIFKGQEELDDLKKVWFDLSKFIDVEFQLDEPKESINNKVNINIVNENDYRNKH